jgi:hypothetical protein
MRRRDLTWLGVTFGAAALLLGVLWLHTAGPFRPVSIEASEDVIELPPVEARTWRREREAWLRELDRNLYGPPPPDIAPSAVDKRPLPHLRLDSGAAIEEWSIRLGDRGRFHLVLVLPRADVPAPLILIETFCGNRAAMPGRPDAISPPLNGRPISCSRFIDPLARWTLGAHINAPPIAEIAERGYGVALLYGGDIVPDRPEAAREALRQLGPAEGAISAWAWLYSRAADVLIGDERIDRNRLAVFGQSRQGKAALLAGARDSRFRAVIALQAGRGGDALTRHRRGESVAHITDRYPHWFAPAFARLESVDPIIDQAHLLAAIAPRRLLIGHARRDAWSDPEGAWLAVRSAHTVFATLEAPAPEFYLRSGRHGITHEDWLRTLAFLDRALVAEQAT